MRSARPGGSLTDKTPPSGYALAAVQDVQGRLSQSGLCCKPLARASGSLQRPAPQQRQAATAGGAAPGDATRHREACAVAGPRHGLPRLPLYRRQLVEANGSAQGTQLAPEVLHPQLPRILGDGAIVLRGVCLGWRWVYVCVYVWGWGWGGGWGGGGGQRGAAGEVLGRVRCVRTATDQPQTRAQYWRQVLPAAQECVETLRARAAAPHKLCQAPSDAPPLLCSTPAPGPRPLVLSSELMVASIFTCWYSRPEPERKP